MLTFRLPMAPMAPMDPVASQKLSTAWFGSKFNFISSRCDSKAFCKESRKRLNTESYDVPEALDGMVR